MKNLLSFGEFVNEHYKIEEATDADGFDPTFTKDIDPTGAAATSLSELTPGKEYVVNGTTDLIYQGYTGGVHVFNGGDEANVVSLTDEELTDAIGKGTVSEVKA
jgi:hypothetical protein